MCDPILDARLDALQGSLKKMERLSRRIPTLFDWEEKDTLGDWRWKDISDRLMVEIRLAINDKSKEIDEIRDLLKKAGKIGDSTERERTTVAAWARYGVVYESSQEEVFHECMDVLGGLAFRAKSLCTKDDFFRDNIDENILRIAEELIADFGHAVFVWPSLIIPAPREALVKTVGRLVRLRCSEWTIWTLPLVAHEFGHIVMEEYKEINKKIETISQAHLLALKEALGPGAKPEPLPRAELEEYLADAYGTYVMGPAFACAAILLRLNPLHLPAGTREPGLDLERSQIILGMLDQMNQPSGPQNGYGMVIKPLRKVWDQMLKRAATSREARGALPTPEDKALDRLVEIIWKQFNWAFVGEDDPSQGWRIAPNWASEWLKALKEGQRENLPTSGVESTSKYRDVLNAAWACRLLHPDPDSVNTIARQAKGVCMSIYEKRRQPGPTGGPLSGTK